MEYSGLAYGYREVDSTEEARIKNSGPRLDPVNARVPEFPRVHAMHSSDLADLILLQRIVARDTAALAELYDRHSGLLFGLVLRIVRDRAEAEEILQEAFVCVWTRAELFDSRLGGPTAWLVRLARNRAIDRLRARRSRDAAAGPALDESIANRAAAATDIRSPEAVVVEAQRRGTVIDALAVLPAEQRCLIEAAFFDGYTHSELAKHFGLPLGTVKTRIRAGIVAMRQRLEHAV
ncbi:MAG TPA: sigma-70 family RNA polymerase sigma factor [Vicinamibacterales bacterium]|nr:sigma-70 family RNA polymerase sigma factor [Vicinamibacterales bacterium]